MTTVASTNNNIFSVQELARRYVENQMGPEPAQPENAPEVAPNHARLRKAFEFKVTGFNVATVATIATFALAIITGSVLSVMAFALSYAVRHSFYKAAISTGAERNIDRIFQRTVLGDDPSENILEYLDIPADADHANWRLNRAQVLDFVLLMNHAPEIRQVEEQVANQNANMEIRREPHPEHVEE